MEYSLVHVHATAEHVDDALRTIAADWSGEVIKAKPNRGEPWSTVRVTERAGTNLAPLLCELLGAPVVLVAVAGERFALSYWRSGALPVGAAAAVKEVATAFGKDPGTLETIMRSTKPPTDRHAEAADLLQLPRPVVTGFEPVFDGRQTLEPSALPAAIARFRRRQLARRLFGPLVLLEVVAFLAVDYFWFLEPSRWVIPVLAVFVVNGTVLLVLRHRLRRTSPR